MKTDWVDFRAVKAAVSIQMVLDHYGVQNLSRRRDELHGPCPIHKAPSRSKNFTASISKNAFKCFSNECGARGNVLDFVVAMETCSIREAALKLNKWFKVGEALQTNASEPEKVVEVPRGVYRTDGGSLIEVIARARHADNQADLIIYRELFGDYRYWAAPPSAFGRTDDKCEAEPFAFELLKPL